MSPPLTTETPTNLQGALKISTSENLSFKERVAELDAAMITSNKERKTGTPTLSDKHSVILDDVPSILAACKEHVLKSARLIMSTDDEAFEHAQEKDDTSVQLEAKRRIELEEVLRTFWGTKEVKWQESVHKIQKECYGLLGKWENEKSKFKAQEEENMALGKMIERYRIENECLKAENNQLVKTNSDLGVVLIERDQEIQENNDEIRRLTHQNAFYDGEISALKMEINDFKEKFENKVVKVHDIRQECEHIYDQILSDFDGLRGEIMALRDENHTLQDKLLDFKSECQYLQNAVLQRDEGIRDKSIEISKLKRRFEQLLKKANNMLEENSTLKAEKNALEGELQPLRDEKRWLEADVLRIEGDVRDKDAQIAANADNVYRLHAQFEYALTGRDPRWELKDWEIESASEEDESDEEKEECWSGIS